VRVPARNAVETAHNVRQRIQTWTSIAAVDALWTLCRSRQAPTDSCRTLQVSEFKSVSLRVTVIMKLAILQKHHDFVVVTHYVQRRRDRLRAASHRGCGSSTKDVYSDSSRNSGTRRVGQSEATQNGFRCWQRNSIVRRSWLFVAVSKRPVFLASSKSQAGAGLFAPAPRST
jgi:hypothetical protein